MSDRTPEHRHAVADWLHRRIEWKFTGNTWMAATVLENRGEHLLIELDDHRFDRLLVETKHTRPLNPSNPETRQTPSPVVQDAEAEKTRERASQPGGSSTLHEAIAIGIDRGLRDLGADVHGCTPSMLTGHVIKQLRETGLHPDSERPNAGQETARADMIANRRFVDQLKSDPEKLRRIIHLYEIDLEEAEKRASSWWEAAKRLARSNRRFATAAGNNAIERNHQRRRADAAEAQLSEMNRIVGEANDRALRALRERDADRAKLDEIRAALPLLEDELIADSRRDAYLGADWANGAREALRRVRAIVERTTAEPAANEEGGTVDVFGYSGEFLYAGHLQPRQGGGWNVFHHTDPRHERTTTEAVREPSRPLRQHSFDEKCVHCSTDDDVIHGVLPDGTLLVQAPPEFCPHFGYDGEPEDKEAGCG